MTGDKLAAQKSVSNENDKSNSSNSKSNKNKYNDNNNNNNNDNRELKIDNAASFTTPCEAVCSLKRCGVCYKTDNNTTHVLTSFRVIQET